MPAGQRCRLREELEGVVGACIEGIFRTTLAIENNSSNEKLREALEFYRDRERWALEALATHRRLHDC